LQAAHAGTDPTPIVTPPAVPAPSIKDQIESQERASERDIAKDRAQRTAEHQANEAALPDAWRQEQEKNKAREQKDDAEFNRKLERERKNLQSLQYDKVEVMRPGDLQLTCSALKSEAQSVEQAGSVMDKQMASDADVANETSTPCVVAGPGCVLANQLAAFAEHGAAGDLQKVRDVRASYQKRHDFLMSQIYAKRCK